MKADESKFKALPSRFQASRKTLLIDRWMAQLIKIGGIGVIACVLGIFIFILFQILPLFQRAKIKEIASIPLSHHDFKILGLDEWGKRPFLLTQEGKFLFLKASGESEEATLPFPKEKEFSVFQYEPESQTIGFGTKDGQFSLLHIAFESEGNGQNQNVSYQLQATPFYTLGKGDGIVQQIDFGMPGNNQWVASLVESKGKLEVHVLNLIQESSLLDQGEIKAGKDFDLTALIEGQAEIIKVNSSNNIIVISTQDGTIYYFTRDADKITLRQKFRPFQDLSDSRVASIDFLFGGVSLYLTNSNGNNRLFSLFVPPGGQERLFGQTKQFESLPGGAATFYSPSLRNKAFLVGNGSYASLRYATTESIRWQEALPFEAIQAALSRKYQQMALLDKKDTLHLYSIKDPYPETGWKAFFGKVWYEGASSPQYVWQSTGGTDAFEPKLSLIPLIIGTLKGTLYAMIFSIPMALLAALYTSQFLFPNYRKIVKPLMELMASLPSVILGFLAALWLAPLIETKIPSVILMLFFMPMTAVFFGLLWGHLPIRLRSRLPLGYECFFIIPLLIIVAWAGWELGPTLERWLFVVTDPSTGQKIADFRLWWPQVTGTPFEQRNSLVVGFMMGFAVIPIIYTIAEDSLSQVPQVLRSGALALGASRWQAAFRIILPTASAGIFSAIMIGLGRAVGETMIVLMATGNTPIMEWNIFSGMRTLSANLAVELPEAPFQGTLYRALFLGAMLLFLMTFLVNTFAEVLRQHLRERYKTL